MAALRNSTATVIRARRRYRPRRRPHVEVRRVQMPKPEAKPNRPRQLVGRLFLAFVISIIAHGLFWLFAPPPKPRPPDWGSHGYIEVTEQVKSKDDQNRNPNKVDQRENVKVPRKPHVPSPHAVAEVEPLQRSPGSSSPAEPTIQSAGKGVAKPSGSPHQPTLSMKQLFDPKALGATVDRWKQSLPSADQYTVPESVGDGSSDTQVAERISARIAGQAAQANTEGMTNGGLISTCNDGIDQGDDGLMDCADKGCRTMPACANTKEFKNYVSKDIPDDDTRGITSMVDVEDDDDGKIHALTMRVEVKHASPGDLALEIEHGGHKQVVRLADRGNHTWHQAYLLTDFIGGDARGKWTITIRDVFAGDAGKLLGWTLYVTRRSS